MSLPIWTDYTKEMALRYVLHLSPNAAPLHLYVALFTNTADPGSGLTFEVSDPSYARQEVIWNIDGTTVFSCDAMTPFSLTNAGSFSGVRVMDTSFGDGNTLFWQDLDTQYDYDAGASVPILASGLRVGLT